MSTVTDRSIEQPEGPAASRLPEPIKFYDDRLGVTKAIRGLGRKLFPDHWSFMLGEVALYSFIVVILSGVFLTLWFVPAMGHTVYDGKYLPLKGVEMSEAYRSALNISFDIRGGLLFRQIHHWAALLFVAALSVHMLRVFFTGAFRKPREMNWVVGGLLLLLAMVAGFSGYSLPDDLLSGNGLRITDGIIKALPIVGTYISFFLFGGEFPGTQIVSRLYGIHILLIPGLIALLLVVHLFMVFYHKHTQYPGPGRTEKNVVGYPVLPVYAAKAGGFFFVVAGVIVFLAALFTINPIWNYGPYDPSPVSAGSQPDWYMAFADGALRLMPGWGEFVIFNHTLSLNILIPALIPAGILFTLLFTYPYLEAWITKDHREHHILDRPRNKPTRTAIGAAGVTWYCVMWAAAGGDLIATHLHMSLNDVTYILRVLFFLGPVLAFWIAKRLALALQRKDRELVLHGRETGRIVRLPHGEYVEVHEPLDDHARWRLVSYDSPDVLPAAPRLDGRVSQAEKLRGRLSRFFFEDRIAPVTPAELEAAHSHERAEELAPAGATKVAVEASTPSSDRG